MGSNKENVADISEPQVLPNEIEFIDLFAHLVKPARGSAISDKFSILGWADVHFHTEGFT